MKWFLYSLFVSWLDIRILKAQGWTLAIESIMLTSLPPIHQDNVTFTNERFGGSTVITFSLTGANADKGVIWRSAIAYALLPAPIYLSLNPNWKVRIKPGVIDETSHMA